jgi:hypothetical protein
MSTKLKQILIKLIKEMSMTAAGPSAATAIPGSGEGMSTRYSWVGGHKLKKKKKKK